MEMKQIYALFIYLHLHNLGNDERETIIQFNIILLNNHDIIAIK